MNLEQHAMQDDEVTCFTSPFISNIDGVGVKSTSYAEVGQGDGETVRGLVLIMVTQFCDYSENNWIVQFKLGNYVVNEYLTQ